MWKLYTPPFLLSGTYKILFKLFPPVSTHISSLFHSVCTYSMHTTHGNTLRNTCNTHKINMLLGTKKQGLNMKKLTHIKVVAHY